MSDQTGTESDQRGFIMAAPVLFDVVKNLYQSAQAHSGPTPPASPMIALICAAASLEAFINEAFEVARIAVRANPNEPEPVKSLVALTELLINQPNTPMKFQLSRLALGDKPLEPGKAPYQDMAFLFKLRNGLVHLEPSGHYTGDAQIGISEQTRGFRDRYLNYCSRFLLVHKD